MLSPLSLIFFCCDFIRLLLIHFWLCAPVTLHRDSLCRVVHRSDDAGIAAEGHVLFAAKRAGVHSVCVENRFSNAPMLVRLAVLDRPAIGDSAIAHHSRIAARIPTAATSELHEFHRAAASLSHRIDDIEFSQLLMRDREQQHRDSTRLLLSWLVAAAGFFIVSASWPFVGLPKCVCFSSYVVAQRYHRDAHASFFYFLAVCLFKWLFRVYNRVSAIESTFTRMVTFFAAECILLALLAAVQLLVVRGWFGDSRQAGQV